MAQLQLVRCVLLGRPLGLSRARILRETKQSSETITVQHLLESFLRSADLQDGDQQSTYKLFVDQTELCEEELLIDISPTWHELSFAIQISSAAEKPPTPGGFQHAAIPLKPRPNSPTRTNAAQHAPSRKGQPSMEWTRCFIGQTGFPVVPFPEMNAAARSAMTLADLRQLLRVCHGFAPTDTTVDVIVANKFVILQGEVQLVKDLWPIEESGLCVYYGLCLASNKLNPCTVRCQRSSGAPMLVPLSTESGVQVLFGSLFVLSSLTAPATGTASISNILSNVQLHSNCAALTSLLAAHLHNPRGSHTLALDAGPFLSQSMYFLFQTLFCQHIGSLRLASPTVVPAQTCRLLEYSREAFAFLLSSPSPGAATIVVNQLAFQQENVNEPPGEATHREFVRLPAPATGSADGMDTTDSNSGEDVFDVGVLRWLIANKPTQSVFGQPAASWAAVLPSLPRDPLLLSLFMSRADPRDESTITYSEPTSANQDGVSRSVIHDLGAYQRQANSPDFAMGLLRVVNLRSLRSQRNAVLTVRGNGAVAVFRSISKCVDNVNVVNPLTPKAGDESCAFESESKQLETWIKANPDSYATRVLSTSQSALPTIEDSRPVTEAIVVLFDCSSSMGSASSFAGTNRLELCQQTLRAFIDRLTGYDYPFRAQLTLFNESSRVVCPFTSIYSRFSEHIAAARSHGGTALYDAIVNACADLKLKFPPPARGARSASESGHCNLQLRLFVLSDGEDVHSKATANNALDALRTSGIVLDSVCIGGDGDFKTLKALALASGGLCFKSKTTEELFHLFESEPMLSLACRPAPQPSTNRDTTAALARFKDPYVPYSTMPKKPLPAQVRSNIVSAGEALVRAQKLAGPPANSSPAFRAVLRALAAYERDPHPLLRVYPSDSTITFWMFTMAGPSGTAYEGGNFLGFVQFPDDFPSSPPVVRMLTPVYHCNVNSDGKVCHSVLDRNWSRDFSIRKVFDCIYGLMLAPDPDDPLDTNIAALYYADRAQYEKNARQCTADFAAKNVQDVLGSIAPLSERACDQLSKLHPPHLTDPLTLELMEDPVITPSGVTYSRASIMTSLLHKAEDPSTRQPLRAEQLIPNRALAGQLQEYRASLLKVHSSDAKMWWS